jgi:hypothetical protein
MSALAAKNAANDDEKELFADGMWHTVQQAVHRRA